MLKKYRSLVPVLFILWLSSCSAVDDMKEMFKKQEVVQKIILENYGWQSQVGFNIHNGTLTQVTLVLDANDVRDQKVARLEHIARGVIKEAFHSEPESIFIQIATVPINAVGNR